MCSACAGDYENPDMTVGDDEMESREDETRPAIASNRNTRMLLERLTAFFVIAGLWALMIAKAESWDRRVEPVAVPTMQPFVRVPMPKTPARDAGDGWNPRTPADAPIWRM